MPTKIEWCEETWNPITGCSPISEGCEHCYARRMAQRLKGRYGYPKDDPFKVTFHPDRLEEPFHWKKPRHIFVVSMGDLFHKDVDPLWIFKIFNIMGSCSLTKHIFLLLTKRPEIMKSAIDAYCKIVRDFRKNSKMDPAFDFYDNVYLGITAENQQRADERIPILLQIPATKHFVSIEPMLGSTTLQGGGGSYIDRWYLKNPYNGNTLDWVIVGGESGPGARPMHPDWPRSVRDQCQEAGVPFFFKQWGEWYPLQEDKEGKFASWYDSDRTKLCRITRTGKIGNKVSISLSESDWPGEIMGKVGKKAAGRLLDGREWNEVPD